MPPVPEGCGILPVTENRLRCEAHSELPVPKTSLEFPEERKCTVELLEDRLERTYRRVLVRALGLCAGALLLTAAVSA